MKRKDLFLGSWRFDPAGANYQLGEPPQSGLYRIEAEDGGYLISMEWTTVEGKLHQLSYHGSPDGINYPYENPAIADTVSMTRVNEHTLDSSSIKGGVVILHARRVLSKDGQTMTVTQSGIGPQGQPYSNVSIYVRQV